MIVEFSTDLDTQKIFAADIEVDMLFGEQFQNSSEILIATFSNPKLVVDSNRIAKLPFAQRESLLTLLTSPSRIARFSKTEHFVNKAKYPLVWAPSIDTFIMCSALHKLDLSSVKKATEIGCGSGLAGKYLLEKLDSKASIDLVDIDHRSIRCAQEAIKSNRVAYHVQKAQDFMKNKQFDLVISNPPYLPSPNGEERPPFGGTALMKFLINNAESFLAPKGRLILLRSSIDIEAIKTKQLGKNFKTRVIKQREVPLKVTSVLNDEQWCEYLSKQKGIQTNTLPGYTFSHELSVVEISKL